MYDTPGIAKSFDCDVLGNHNLNVWNSYSVKNLSDSGFKSLILSSELSYGEIKGLVTKYQYIKDKDTDLNIIIQGNLEVMSSKDDFSNLNEGRDFIIKDSSDYAILEDQKRKKFKYKVVFDYNRHSHFINKDCLCLIDEIELIKDLGVNTVIIDCRFSGYKYSTQIISLYAQALRKDNNVDLKILKEQIESITMTRLNKGNFINGRIHEKPNKC
jgi:putative protease